MDGAVRRPAPEAARSRLLAPDSPAPAYTRQQTWRIHRLCVDPAHPAPSPRAGSIRAHPLQFFSRSDRRFLSRNNRPAAAGNKRAPDAARFPPSAAAAVPRPPRCAADAQRRGSARRRRQDRGSKETRLPFPFARFGTGTRAPAQAVLAPFCREGASRIFFFRPRLVRQAVAEPEEASGAALASASHRSSGPPFPSPPLMHLSGRPGPLPCAAVSIPRCPLVGQPLFAFITF
jgi:hypothetical protein